MKSQINITIVISIVLAVAGCDFLENYNCVEQGGVWDGNLKQCITLPKEKCLESKNKKWDPEKQWCINN